MQLLNLFRAALSDFWSQIRRQSASDWWVEITTIHPSCNYYFGPFESAAAAQAASPGYVEDLEGEAAQGIAVSIKRCQPEVFTICSESS
ncbi:DUF1816 domain-containing protein [Trichocoleus desertorum AS-A10]|uniref:DUF1816 domain-containing protein n=1 Tax=Trichocoleus desertorum TaxID=1481672 RepID=UPI00329A663E